MKRRAERTQPEIFSFSFLDILACTVGALAFILTIMLLNVSGSFSKSAVLQKAECQLALLRKELDSLQKQNADLVAETGQVADELAELERAADAESRQAEQALAIAQEAERVAEAAKVEANEIASQLKSAKSRLKKVQDRDTALNNEKTRLERDRIRLLADFDALQKKLAELEQRQTANLKEYQQAVAARDENRRLSTQLRQLESTVATLAAQNEQNQQTVDALTQLETRRDQLTAQVAQTTQELQETRARLAVAVSEQDEQPVRPPYFLLVLLAVAAMILLAVLLARRRNLPKGTPQQLEAQTKWHKKEITRLQRQIEDTKQNIQGRENTLAASEDLQELKSQVEGVNRRADEAEQKAQVVEDELSQRQHELAQIRQQKNAARGKLNQAQKSGHDQVVPRAIEGPGGTSRTPVHVECTAGGLVIHPAGQRVLTSQISSARSDYGRLVRDVAALSASRCIVLWVRPDGLDAFRSARDVAQECGAGIGWEPADRDWNFVFDQQPLGAVG